MNANETRPLPNAADKAALKTIATSVIQTCPSLKDTAHEVASGLLKNSGITGLDPDLVYFHRFDASQSSSKAFTGWEHVHATPTSTMTLTQLVIQRFRVSDQDNADLLDVYAGFYTAGPNADTFNETNEVRLHGNEVLKAFWSIDFSSMYRERLMTFWSTSATDFRTLAKCNFLIQAVKARDQRQLSDDDFQFVTGAVIGPITWPVTLQLLQAEHPCADNVCALDVDGHVANNILRFITPKGRQIVYLPGEAAPFQVLETVIDMHYWVLEQMNADTRQGFMLHFSLADRQKIAENITDLMNRLVSTWGKYDHHLINQKNETIGGDAFTWLRDMTQGAMFAEADLSLTSNGDLRKKLWIGYLSAGAKMFGPMAFVGWPVALPLVGAGIASMGLNIDQAVHGKTAQERKAGVLGAVLAAVDVLFNLLALKGPGSLQEAGPEIDAAEAKEMSEFDLAREDVRSDPVRHAKVDNLDEPEEALKAKGTQPAGSSVELSTDVDPPLAGASHRPEVPTHWQANELLEDRIPVRAPGKDQGIYRLDSNPPTAILLDDMAFYVRYEADVNGGGTWAIIDPEHPNAFSGSLPVRLNAQGEWELTPQAGLKGGGNRHPGKLRTPAQVPTPGSSRTPAPEPTPATARNPTTPYDTDERLRTRGLALGKTETHVRVVAQPGGRFRGISTFDQYVATPRTRLEQDTRTFFSRRDVFAALPGRPGIPTVTPTTTTTELIQKVFDVAPGLVIGESPDRIASMRFLVENMPALAARQVRTLYFHRLLNDFNQVDLNLFFTTGEMSDDLETSLRQLQSDPSEQFTPLEVVKAAQRNGIRIQATDCLASYRYPWAVPATEEQAIKTYLTHTLMQADQSLNGTGNWVVLTDQNNINTFRGMPGISEMQGGIGLRIAEAPLENNLLIEIDHGVEVRRGLAIAPEDMPENSDTLFADLNLQMPTRPLTWTPEELERLLSHPGMFTFEKSDGQWTLIHRSSNGQIVRTTVERTMNLKYMIFRDSWPDIYGTSYANIDELSRALNLRGMTQVGRIPS